MVVQIEMFFSGIRSDHKEIKGKKSERGSAKYITRYVVSIILFHLVYIKLLPINYRSTKTST